jgi:hydroxymethylbilane synthase
VTLRLGTRGSALALTQSGEVASTIARRLGREVELVEIVTSGDRSAAPVVRLGVGVFVSALRDALLAKEIDIAVHSYKDLPTAPTNGLVIAAVPQRVDPRDALVASGGRTLAELPSGARIGTGSPRRAAQLLALGMGLVPVAVRGNVDSRLRRLAEGEFDAVVLARAGLMRLGRPEVVTEILDPLLMLPAPAQGALAIECREDDVDLRELLGGLDDQATRAAVIAERALLAALEAGCSAPVAALAEVAEGDVGPEIYLRGGVFSEDGSFVLRRSRTAPATEKTLQAVADQVGRELATDLLAEGAETVLGVHHDPQP